MANKNGHWYTDKNGHHYFVENGQTPQEGWEASKRRKMINGGKYQVSEDGNEYKDVEKDEYDKFEADDSDFDENIDDDFGFDEEDEDNSAFAGDPTGKMDRNEYIEYLENEKGWDHEEAVRHADMFYDKAMQGAQEQNAAMSEGEDEDKKWHFEESGNGEEPDDFTLGEIKGFVDRNYEGDYSREDVGKFLEHCGLRNEDDRNEILDKLGYKDNPENDESQEEYENRIKPEAEKFQKQLDAAGYKLKENEYGIEKKEPKASEEGKRSVSSLGLKVGDKITLKEFGDYGTYGNFSTKKLTRYVKEILDDGTIIVNNKESLDGPFTKKVKLNSSKVLDIKKDEEPTGTQLPGQTSIDNLLSKSQNIVNYGKNTMPNGSSFLDENGNFISSKNGDMDHDAMNNELGSDLYNDNKMIALNPGIYGSRIASIDIPKGKKVSDAEWEGIKNFLENAQAQGKSGVDFGNGMYDFDYYGVNGITYMLKKYLNR